MSCSKVLLIYSYYWDSESKTVFQSHTDPHANTHPLTQMGYQEAVGVLYLGFLLLAAGLGKLHYTTLTTIVAFYARGHVGVDLKSSVPVWFPTEEALGILLVPNSGALSLKVIYTKRDKE